MFRAPRFTAAAKAMRSRVSRGPAVSAGKRSSSDASIPPTLEERYPAAMRAMHWGMAAGILGCFATVKSAQYSTGERKGQLMRIHKSFGLLMMGAIVPRVLIRLASRVPAHVPRPKLEVLAGNVSHFLMYGLMIFMPVTGIAMGYYGGKGLPFFGLHINGIDKPDPSIAKPAFKAHKLAGQAFEVLVPIHIGAVGFHAVARSQNLLKRIT